MSLTVLTQAPIATRVDFDAYPSAIAGLSAKPGAPGGSGAPAKPGGSAGPGGSRLFRYTPQGDVIRPPYPFQGRIAAGGDFPPAFQRYVLYVSYACPWAQRQLIVRELKGLQAAIPVAVVDPVRDGRGWAFREGPDLTLDHFNGFTFLREAYEATSPGYPGHISVPVLWDTVSQRIVSNNFPDISLDLGGQFNAWADNPDLDLYPQELRPEIDALNAKVYDTVNNGVYKAGGARNQGAYDRAIAALFATLDELEERLAGRTHLFGDRLTEADIRLWVTLARFDAVYVTHFRTNLRRLVDYPNLWDYARFLYRIPAFSETTKFDHIKRHYYITHDHLNPHRIVPIGLIADWDAPTQR
ncbi:MAG: glutathione S-transferase C-terminal domain-containing protein [Bifidobacteriaceae bacterium]|jgi:putative glutathione S-transferase|nr:glutathione S-transferase C-terminal domain-containing protein [Bifidobacteriaceae bacterium]